MVGRYGQSVSLFLPVIQNGQYGNPEKVKKYPSQTCILTVGHYGQNGNTFADLDIFLLNSAGS